VPVEAQVVGWVFDGDRGGQCILRARDVGHDAVPRLGGARKGQQVRKVLAVPRRPGQVLRNQGGLDALRECGQPLEMRGIGRRIACQRQRDAVQRHRMPRADRVQPSDARPARHHVVLGVHLEPQAFDTCDDSAAS
jgi:hypothetical protein